MSARAPFDPPEEQASRISATFGPRHAAALGAGGRTSMNAPSLMTAAGSAKNREVLAAHVTAFFTPMPLSAWARTVEMQTA